MQQCLRKTSMYIIQSCLPGIIQNSLSAFRTSERNLCATTNQRSNFTPLSFEPRWKQDFNLMSFQNLKCVVSSSGGFVGNLFSTGEFPLSSWSTKAPEICLSEQTAGNVQTEPLLFLSGPPEPPGPAWMSRSTWCPPCAQARPPFLRARLLPWTDFAVTPSPTTTRTHYPCHSVWICKLNICAYQCHSETASRKSPRLLKRQKLLVLSQGEHSHEAGHLGQYPRELHSVFL